MVRSLTIKRAILPVVAMMILLLTGCSKKTMPSTLAYRTNKTECLSVDPSGTVILRVWGEGLDAKAARMNGVKRAVEEVTFSTIPGSKAALTPVIPSPTARARYSDYFNKFFKNNGKYKKYVKASNPDKGEYVNGNGLVVVPMVVTVDRAALVKQFAKDKVTE